MHINVVCFTTHRLTNTTIRGNGHGKAKASKRTKGSGWRDCW